MLKIAFFPFLLSFLCRKQFIPKFCSRTEKAPCYVFKHVRNSFSDFPQRGSS